MKFIYLIITNKYIETFVIGAIRSKSVIEYFKKIIK